jgi:putative methionine-R-sulfoxide reductase with GAF domain
MAVQHDPSLADLLAVDGGAAPEPGATTGAIGQPAGLDGALQQIAEQSQVMTHAGGAAVALRAGEHMVCRARAGSMAPPLGAPINITTGLTGECVRTGRLLVCNETETDLRVDVEVCRALDIRSIVVMPIFLESELVAIFEVFSPRPNVFNQDELEALEIMRELVVSVLRPEPAAPAQQSAAPASTPQLADRLLGDDVETAFRNSDPEDDLICEVEACAPSLAAQTPSFAASPARSLAALSPVERERDVDVPALKISPIFVVTGLVTLVLVLVWLNWCNQALPRAVPRQSVPAASSPAPVAPAARAAEPPPAGPSVSLSDASHKAVPASPAVQKPPRPRVASAQARRTAPLPPPLLELPTAAPASGDIAASLVEAQASVPPPAPPASPTPGAQAASGEAADIAALLHAAAQGRAQAQLDLAVRYANGDGVVRSYPDALHWFSRAQAQGLLPRDAAALDARERTEAWLLEHMEGKKP